MDYYEVPRRVPLRMGNRRGMAFGVRYAPAGATYFAAGALPTGAPNFNSSAPRSAWWLEGPLGNATVNATTGYEFVRSFQLALGVSADGNWGPGTATAFRNWLAANMPTSGNVVPALANLNALISGAARTIEPVTLLFAIWFTYYRNTINRDSMVEGTSIVRLGTNAMLSSVRTPPYRAAPPRPTRAEGRVTWNENQPAPPVGGTGVTTPPRPPTPGTNPPGPGTTPPGPGPTPPGPGPGTTPPNVFNPGNLAGNTTGGVMGWWNRQTTGTKVAIGVGAAALTALGVWAVTAEPQKKPAPRLPPPTTYRPTVKVQFEQRRTR